MKYSEYDRKKYTVWALPHPLLLHWIINPGLAFNELILGQRMPKVTLIDKTLDKPLMERSFIPGPSCGEIIPCLWNLTSLLILAATSPIWFFPVKYWKANWIEFEKSRYQNIEKEYTPHEKTSWVKMGFLYGGLMWLILGLAPQVYKFIVWKSFDWDFLLFTAALWTIAGFFFAVVMYIWLGLRPKRKMQDGQENQ